MRKQWRQAFFVLYRGVPDFGHDKNGLCTSMKDDQQLLDLREDGIVVANWCHAQPDKSELKSYWTSIASTCAQNNTTKVLVCGDRTMCKLGTTSAYDIGEYISKLSVIGLRIAVFATAPQEPQNFLETVLHNRGVSLRFFPRRTRRCAGCKEKINDRHPKRVVLPRPLLRQR